MPYSNPRVTFTCYACGLRGHIARNCRVRKARNNSNWTLSYIVGLLLSYVGFVDPPHLVMPITIEPMKPRMCHDERFLNLWIKDCPSTLDYITDLPRYVGLNHFQSTIDDKSGYNHIPLHPSSYTFFGLQWKCYLLTPPFPPGGRPVRTYTTLLARRLQAT